MTTTETPELTDAEVAAQRETAIKLQDAALAQMRKSFKQLVAAYGTEAEALHAFVYAFDVDTRVRALSRIMSDNAPLGQPSTVMVHLGGYEYTLKREQVGKPETRIIAPEIGIYDRNGIKFGADGYGVKRKKGADPNVADNMIAAMDRIASNVGRMQVRVAEAANIVHVPATSPNGTDATTKPRAASPVSSEMAAMRQELADAREREAKRDELLAQLLAKLG